MTIHVLIVDDDPAKTARIVDVIDACHVSDVAFKTATNLHGARRLLAQEQFDMAIIDIALPSEPDAPARFSGGTQLLQDINQRDDLFKTPTHIIGLTAYEDALALASPLFASALWTVLKYEPAAQDWQDGICFRLKHIALTKRGNGGDFQSHVCIITALQSPELDAVLQLPWSWSKSLPDDDVAIYYEGAIGLDSTKKVVATCCPRMGIAAASSVTMKLIERFRPRYLAMAGISGGIKGQCRIGDVVAAESSWHWESGKRSVVDGEHRLEPAPHQINVSPFIRSRMTLAQQDILQLAQIKKAFQGTKPDADLSVVLGPMASGSSVIADADVVQQIINQNRRTTAIEMESYGVYAASEEARIPKPEFFCFKGVSDFADRSKNDQFQPYAAYASARVLQFFLETIL